MVTAFVHLRLGLLWNWRLGFGNASEQVHLLQLPASALIIADAAGRAKATLDGLGQRTTQVYDPAGRRKALVDALGQRTTFAYNEAGQPRFIQDANLKRTTLAYDEAGQRKLRLDARGNRTTFVYDLVGRPSGRRYPDASRVTLAYDELGQRRFFWDATGRNTFAYDQAGRVRRTTNPAGKTTTTLYDAAGQRTDLVEPGAGLTTYTYYDDGRMSNERVAADGSMQWLYDEAGKMRRIQVMDYRVTYVHDEADRMTRLTSFHRTLLVTMTDFKYAFDKVGNRTRVVDLDNERTTWTYDKAYRLTREQRVGTTATYDNTYRYDAAGNRTVKVAGAARTTYAYNAGNQLLTYKDGTGTTTFTYDDTGNRRTKKETSGTTTYTWDYENRLTSVRLPAGTRNTFTYNSDGQRVKVERPTETRKQIWDEARIIQETDNSDVVQTQYRQEPAGYGNLLSQRRGTHRDVLHYDALGTTSKVTFHNTTEVRARYWSDAWGNILATSGSPTVTPFRFVGRLGYYRDDDTGLYLLSERFYDPVTGRFLSKDPLGFIDGPNRYLYVSGRPTVRVDPSGLRTGMGKYRDCRCQMMRTDIWYHVLWGSSSTRRTRRVHFKYAADVFMQCCLALGIKGITFWSEDATLRAIGNDLVLDEYQAVGSPTAEELRMTDGQTTDVFNAYYVRALSLGNIAEAFWFAAWNSPPAPAVAVSDAAVVRSFAHELGHVLLDSGEHNVPASNLMAQTSVATQQEILTEAQCDKIRNHRLLKPWR